MAFKMNKPSITQGTTAYKSALKHMLPGGKSHLHTNDEGEEVSHHSHKTNRWGETTEQNYAVDEKGVTQETTNSQIPGQVEKETEENSSEKANQENSKRLRTQENKQKGNEMSGVNSGFNKNVEPEQEAAETAQKNSKKIRVADSNKVGGYVSEDELESKFSQEGDDPSNYPQLSVQDYSKVKEDSQGKYVVKQN